MLTIAISALSTAALIGAGYGLFQLGRWVQHRRTMVLIQAVEDAGMAEAEELAAVLANEVPAERPAMH